MPEDEVEPYSPPVVRRRCRAILEYGRISFTSHALARMDERDLKETDVVNIVRGGAPDEAMEEHGTWRYRIRTPKACVIVAFCLEDPMLLRVVSAWRT